MMFNHNALIEVGADYQSVLKAVSGEFCSLTNDETTGGQAYQTLCFQTAEEISAEQEQQLLALPHVHDVGLNQ